MALDDGSIWTAQANSTDPSNPSSFVGRANVQAAVIVAAVVALPRPQLLQDGVHVVFVAPPGPVATGAPTNLGIDGQRPVDLNEAGEVGQRAWSSMSRAPRPW